MQRHSTRLLCKKQYKKNTANFTDDATCLDEASHSTSTEQELMLTKHVHSISMLGRLRNKERIQYMSEALLSTHKSHKHIQTDTGQATQTNNHATQTNGTCNTDKQPCNTDKQTRNTDKQPCNTDKQTRNTEKWDIIDRHGTQTNNRGGSRGWGGGNRWPIPSLP